MNIKNIYSDLWEFLKNPKDEANTEQSFKLISQNIIALLLLDIPIMAIILGLMSILENAGLLDTENHSVLEFLKNSPIYVIFLAGVLVVPFIEELLFRLYLRFEWNPILRLMLFISKRSKASRYELIEESIRYGWRRNYKFLIYFSAAFFALVHLSNFEKNMYVLLTLPILVAPQFIIGLFLAFLRVRFGLLSGFALHAIHNLIFIMIPLIFLMQNVELMNEKTKDYELKIEEIAFADKDKNAVFVSDSIIVNNMTLKSSIAGLLKVEEYEIECDHENQLEKSLNIRVINKDTSNDINTLLLNKLKQQYHFAVDTIVSFEDIWELLPIDENILAKYISKSSTYDSKVNQSSDQQIFTNADLNLVANSISSQFNEKVRYEGSNSLRYDFALENNNFEDVAEKLEQFGLTLKKSKANVNVYKVRFLKI